MPTVGQALQSQPKPEQAPWFVTVLAGSTPATIQTAAGPIVNGLWGNVAAGKRVVVMKVEGIDVAIGIVGAG